MMVIGKLFGTEDFRSTIHGKGDGIGRSETSTYSF